MGVPITPHPRNFKIRRRRKRSKLKFSTQRRSEKGVKPSPAPRKTTMY